jgi:hypothetical protein
MRPRRLTGAILALGVTLVAFTSPAGAHPGFTAFRIDVGVATSLFALVPADYGKPISQIDVDAPAGFVLADASAPAGWHLNRTASSVSFTGGPIAVYDSVLFTIKGTAQSSGMLLFPVTTHSPDGSVMRYTGGPGTRDAALIVYSGSAPAVTASSGFPWKTVGAAALAGCGVIGALALFIRRRRAAPLS